MALLCALIAFPACAAYDPDLLPSRSRTPAPPAGSGASGAGGSGGSGGAGFGDAAVRDAALMDAEPPRDAQPPHDAQPPRDAAEPDSAAPDAGAGDSGQTDAGADAGTVCGDGAGAEDCCLDDPAKTAPGTCGCGVADSDGDGDGTADCVDGCAADAMKTAPGICGCGRVDSDQGATVSCSGLRDALLHRYRFDGTGTAVVDARGDRDGTVINAALDGSGQLDLAGGSSNQYVDLPNGLISALTDATVEVWVTWAGGTVAWQRIFDFGDSNAAEGSQGTGASYLFLTPRNANGVLRVAYSVSGSTQETVVNGSAALSSSGMRHLAVVIDASNDQMRLYLDGAAVGSVAFGGALAGIDDVNNWLGRSQYSTDPELDGVLHEFRIYGAALSAAQIALSFGDGPDPAYLEP